MPRFILLSLAFSLHFILFSTEIIVADMEDFIEGGEQYTYAFAPGDKVKISIQTIKGSADELKVIEYPDAIRYKVYKVPKQFEQQFDMPNGGFLTLQMIKLSTGKARVKIRITREPASQEYADFPTMVKWRTVFDTLWIMGNPADVKTDTVYGTKVVREPLKSDTLAIMMVDKQERLRSSAGVIPYTANVNVSFPRNEQSETISREVISWAYYLSSGGTAISTGEPLMMGVGIAGITDPVAALALGLVSVISGEMAPGQSFGYKLMYKNITSEIEIMDEGYGPSAYGYRNSPKQGAFTITLSNTATFEIGVHVKVIAAIRQTTFKTDTIRVVKQVVGKQSKQSAYKLIERKEPYHTIE
jgi:hypothetical protein